MGVPMEENDTVDYSALAPRNILTPSKQLDKPLASQMTSDKTTGSASIPSSPGQVTCVCSVAALCTHFGFMVRSNRQSPSPSVSRSLSFSPVSAHTYADESGAVAVPPADETCYSLPEVAQGEGACV